MFATIQRLIEEETSLDVPAAQLTPSADLYALGMTSFDAARLMVAIERAFKVDFPPDAMRRETMASIVAIALAVLSLWQAEMDRPDSRKAA
jgi:acyl carrier protein